MTSARRCIPVWSNGECGARSRNALYLWPALRFCMRGKPLLHSTGHHPCLIHSPHDCCCIAVPLASPWVECCCACHHDVEIVTPAEWASPEGDTSIWAAVKWAAPGPPLRLPLPAAWGCALARSRLFTPSPFCRAAVSASVGGYSCAKSHASGSLSTLTSHSVQGAPSRDVLSLWSMARCL